MSVEDNTHLSEEIVRAIVDQTIVGFVRTDLDGRLTFTNSRYCEITGYPCEELLGKRFSDFTYPEDVSYSLEVFQRMMQNTAPLYFEKRYVRKNGEIVWVSLSPCRIRDAHGKIVGESAFVVDISERKRMLDELQVSEERFRRLFENSRDALMTLAPPSWKFTSANRSTLELFGAQTETEFTKFTPWDVSPVLQPDGQLSLDKAQKMIETALQKGSHFFEWMHRRLNDKMLMTEVLLSRLEENGQIKLQATVRDITERKRLEKEILERRNEMEELQKSQVAAQTAAAIAHELNQPLSAVASYNETALMLLNAETPDMNQIRESIELSVRQALRAGQSIRQMFEYLSMRDFPRESFNLNQEIMDVLETTRREHELHFRSVLHLDEHLPMVQANRIHIRKVLINLVHNGIEAMRIANVPTPAITVTVQTRTEQKVAQVTIRDNGPGIRHEDIERLFEPFFTTKTDGIGIGLAISRSLVEMNGGQLWIDPDEGPGATFHLTLPFAL